VGSAEFVSGGARPSDESPSIQIAVDGLFAGFKRPCGNCEQYFYDLSDDGWCANCARESEALAKRKTTLRDLLVAARAHSDRCHKIMVYPKHWVLAMGLTEEEVFSLFNLKVRPKQKKEDTVEPTSEGVIVSGTDQPTTLRQALYEEARERGLDPSEVTRLAEEVKRAESERITTVRDALKHARETLGVSKNNKMFKDGSDSDSLQRAGYNLDDVASEMVDMFPGVLDPEDPAQSLWDLMLEDVPNPGTFSDRFRRAMDILAKGDVVPF